MAKLRAFCLLAVVACVIGVGCSDVTEVRLTDEGEIAVMIAELVWFQTKYVQGPEDTSSTTGNPIVPLYWWREWDEEPPFDLDIQMNSDRDSALVTLTLDISGTLHNIALDTAGMVVDTVDKVINEGTLRYAVFLKDTVETYHEGWRLYKISSMELSSDNATVRLDSVRLKCSSYPNTVYSDPLALITLDEVFSFSPGEGVSLWAYTNDDTANVYFHSRKGSDWSRWEFTNQGGGAYFGVWSAPTEAVVYHCAFDMLHRGTLWDSEYRYDCNAWLMPFTIE